MWNLSYLAVRLIKWVTRAKGVQVRVKCGEVPQKDQLRKRIAVVNSFIQIIVCVTTRPLSAVPEGAFLGAPDVSEVPPLPLAVWILISAHGGQRRWRRYHLAFLGSCRPQEGRSGQRKPQLLRFYSWNNSFFLINKAVDIDRPIVTQPLVLYKMRWPHRIAYLSITLVLLFPSLWLSHITRLGMLKLQGFRIWTQYYR